MKYVKLGKSDLQIPTICLGSNNFGAQVTKSDSLRILDTALDLGINMVDTADIYTQGKSEEILGIWAKDRRQDVIIATKVGMEQRDDPNKTGLSRSNIQTQLKASLVRLQTDYIDLYYVHQFDEHTPLIETLETLDKLLRENTIRHIACSNFSAQQLGEALDVSEREGLRGFIANQVRYNIFQREIESEIMPFSLSKSVSILAYSPLRSGLLAGRYERNAPAPPGSRGSFRGPEYLKNLKIEENIGRIEKLKEIATEIGVSLPVLSIGWILHHDGMSSAVVGASNPEQIREVSKASEIVLSSDTVNRINEI